MTEYNVEYVNSTSISCDGGEGEHEHPRVYLSLKKQNTIICQYCGKKFIHKDTKSINK